MVHRCTWYRAIMEQPLLYQSSQYIVQTGLACYIKTSCTVLTTYCSSKLVVRNIQQRKHSNAVQLHASYRQLCMPCCGYCAVVGIRFGCLILLTSRTQLLRRPPLFIGSRMATPTRGQSILFTQICNIHTELLFCLIKKQLLMEK